MKLKATRNRKPQSAVFHGEAKGDFLVRSEFNNTDLAVRMLEINSRPTAHSLNAWHLG